MFFLFGGRVWLDKGRQWCKVMSTCNYSLAMCFDGCYACDDRLYQSVAHALFTIKRFSCAIADTVESSGLVVHHAICPQHAPQC